MSKLGNLLLTSKVASWVMLVFMAVVIPFGLCYLGIWLIAFGAIYLDRVVGICILGVFVLYIFRTLL